MKWLACLIVLLIVTALPRFANAGDREVRACDFQVKARCASGDVRVTLAHGAVQRVEIDVDWCGLPHRPGYVCTVDSSRGDEDSQWSEDGNATLIANGSPWNPSKPDRIKVTVGTQVAIDLSETQSLGRCGSGAELPQTIVIPAQKGACRVRLREP
jgi:hypothetical protein